MNSVHAHAVLEWIGAQADGATVKEIVAWSEETFGRLATYHTCRLNGMDVRQLLSFFVSSEKVVVTGGNRLSLNAGRMCTHKH